MYKRAGCRYLIPLRSLPGKSGKNRTAGHHLPPVTAKEVEENFHVSVVKKSRSRGMGVGGGDGYMKKPSGKYGKYLIKKSGTGMFLQVSWHDSCRYPDNLPGRFQAPATAPARDRRLAAE
jgi:hypothetical protein